MTALATDKTVKTHAILNRTVCLVLACSYLSNVRAVSLGEVKLKRADGETDLEADTRQLGMSKRLLDPATLSPIMHLFNAAKNYMRGVACSGHRVFGPGTYLVPVALVVEVDKRLKEFNADITAAIETMLKDYPKAVEARAAALGDLYRAADYLSVEAMRDRFSFEWSYVSFDSPENLESISSVIAEDSANKHRARLASAYDYFYSQMRETLRDIVSGVCDRLTPSEDGKRKVLRGTALDDLMQFVATFPAKNVTEDDELSSVVERLKTLTSRVTVNHLKHVPEERQSFKASVDAVLADLNKLVETAPRRTFGFGKFGNGEQQ